jgi:signal transduction histidine kinase
MEPGGCLTVSTTYAPEAGTVTVVVEDTGRGMSEETLSRAFDLFFTTKPDGTGLGMAQVRSVVDLHGGALEVHSATGKGTRVRIRLPVAGAR